jgi:DNA-binding NtrC family response regulator
MIAGAIERSRACRDAHDQLLRAALALHRGSPNRPERLLIVDDEPMVLNALARVLRSQYDVKTLSCPLEALRCLTAGESCHIVLSDVMMPDMNGVEFVRRVAQARPDLVGRIVLMTGGTSTSKVLAALEQSGCPVIAKPFDLDALHALLANLSSGHP